MREKLTAVQTYERHKHPAVGHPYILCLAWEEWLAKGGWVEVSKFNRLVIEGG